MRQIMRVSCWVNIDHVAQLEVMTKEEGERVCANRFIMTDANQLLDVAEKLRLVGLDMLREKG